MTHVLGRHELLVRLAAGGAANVFLAKDTSPGSPERLLALKVLLPNLAANEDFLKMFFTEARIAAQLRHENIVQIAGFGRMGGIHSLAMEYVFGASLAQVLRQSARKRKPLTVGVLLKITASVCSALHYAHELRDEAGQSMGLVHRDVTPQNILIGFNGRPKLTDFGIAKATNRGWETQVGVVKGKFCYMSPEQALGKKVDRRSDIFGVGIVLWEALTGRDLFKGSSPMEVIAAIREQEIVPPSQMVEGLSPVVDPIVMKALRRSPRSRYSSALEMQQSIETLIGKAGVTINQNTISHELAEIFGDVIPKRALALRHAMLGHGDPSDLCEVLNAQPLNHGHLPAPNLDEADEEDPLGLFGGGNANLSIPSPGITGLLPALPEQPFTANFDAAGLQEELRDQSNSYESLDDDAFSELSELEFEGTNNDLDEYDFAPIDSWNDQTEMIEDHDELLELLSEEDISQGKIPAVFTARFGSNELPHGLEPAEMNTSTHSPLEDLGSTQGIVNLVADHLMKNTDASVSVETPSKSAKQAFEGDATISGVARPDPALLLGEHLNGDSELKRPMPRAPSLDLDFDRQTPTPARAVPLSLLSNSNLLPANSLTDPVYPKPLKAKSAESRDSQTDKEVPILNHPNSEGARQIVGKPLTGELELIRPPSPEKPKSPTAPVIAAQPASVKPNTVPQMAAQSAVRKKPNMLSLRLDVLLLLVVALILFGIAIGLGVAKFIGLPTLT